MPSRALLVAGLLAAGCAEEIAGTLAPPVPRAGSGRFLAGAAKADLTPMPGFPMGGFSIVGRTARGYWTRLKARIVYLEDAAGAPLVLVACDLWSVPAGLADRVAELLAANVETRHVDRGRLVLAATHTHHSPGNFSTSEIYNAYGSPKAGFDRELFEFLARRVTDGIGEAARRRQPAAVRLGAVRLAGVARNRSFAAFALDPERDEVLGENRDLAVTPLPGHEPDAYRALDPTLTVLRIDPAGGPGAPIAVAAFFAVHATAMGSGSELYSSDLFGVAATLVERRLAGSMVALFNGAEGDVSPDWEAQDRRGTLAVGGRLADAILAAMASPGEPLEAALEARFDPAVPLAGARATGPDGMIHVAAEGARMGAAAVGGAEDGRTALYAAGWHEGVRGERRPGQGPKQLLLDPWGFEPRGLAGRLLGWLERPPAGPETLPAGVYRVGPVVLATLPGEFTTVLGRRIAAGIRAASGGDARVLLVGLANEYRSYFTTPEEYDAQHYEGGSTLYGPESGTVVALALARLARELGEPPPLPASRRYSYRPGPRRSFGLDDLGAPPTVVDDGLADVLQDLATGRPVRSYPCVVWEDARPAWSADRVTPTVGIETRSAAGGWGPLTIDGIEETDEGLDLVTIALAASEGGARWAAFWMPPEKVPSDAEVRFRVSGVDGVTRHSPPLAPAGARPGAPSCLAAAAG